MPIELSALQRTGYAPSMPELAHDDIVYLAALIDGEGSVGFGPRSGNPSRLGYGYIRVYNTHEPLIDWLRSLGGHITTRKPRYTTPPGAQTKLAKPLFTWLVDRQDDVAYLLRVTLPYMRVKRARAEAALASMGEPREWVRTNWHPPH